MSVSLCEGCMTEKVPETFVNGRGSWQSICYLSTYAHVHTHTHTERERKKKERRKERKKEREASHGLVASFYRSDPGSNCSELDVRMKIWGQYNLVMAIWPSFI